MEPGASPAALGDTPALGWMDDSVSPGQEDPRICSTRMPSLGSPRRARVSVGSEWGTGHISALETSPCPTLASSSPSPGPTSPTPLSPPAPHPSPLTVLLVQQLHLLQHVLAHLGEAGAGLLAAAQDQAVLVVASAYAVRGLPQGLQGEASGPRAAVVVVMGFLSPATTSPPCPASQSCRLWFPVMGWRRPGGNQSSATATQPGHRDQGSPEEALS